MQVQTLVRVNAAIGGDMQIHDSGAYACHFCARNHCQVGAMKSSETAAPNRTQINDRKREVLFITANVVKWRPVQGKKIFGKLRGDLCTIRRGLKFDPPDGGATALRSITARPVSSRLVVVSAKIRCRYPSRAADGSGVCRAGDDRRPSVDRRLAIRRRRSS